METWIEMFKRLIYVLAYKCIITPEDKAFIEGGITEAEWIESDGDSFSAVERSFE